MLPTEFEEYVASYYRTEGFLVQLTPETGDYGVDLFLNKAGKKIAVQVKMYGGSSRKINRRIVMELHGAKDYFGCDQAILVTDGAFMADAIEVAKKLQIQTLVLDQRVSNSGDIHNQPGREFDEIWRDYVIPLEGQVLTRRGGSTNQIVKVDWGGITRITSNGRSGHIDIEIFRHVMNHLLRVGSITRQEINLEYDKRASSGIVLILAQVPFVEITYNPITLKIIAPNDVSQN